MRFTLSWYILYVAQNYRPVRIFPIHAYLINLKIFHASLPEESWLFPVIELSRIDCYWSVLGFCSSCQFSLEFVVPTVECLRGYDIDLTIYSLFWTSQMMFVLWWSPERFLKSLPLSCKNVLCFLVLSLLERPYLWGFPDTKSYLNLIFIIQLVECLHRCNVGMISNMKVKLFVNLTQKLFLFNYASILLHSFYYYEKKKDFPDLW